MIKRTGTMTNVVANLKSDMVRLIKKGRMLLDGNMRTVIYLECNAQNEFKQVDLKVPFHYIHLLDTSGSMSIELPKLKQSVIESIKGMETGDKLSVIVFNTPSGTKFILKGVEVDSKHLNEINHVINGISCSGATCFSKPLEMTYEYIKSNQVQEHCSACICTDGEMNAPWSNAEELQKVRYAVNNLKNHVTAINTIGYSEMYNESFLKEIAESTKFGKYTHINHIGEYKNIFKNDFKNLKSSVKQSFMIEAKGMILYANEFKSILKDDILALDYLNNKNNVIVCVLDEGENNIILNGTKVDIDEITDCMDESEMKRFSYTFAKELAYSGKVAQSKQILNTLGENSLAQKVESKDRTTKQDIYTELTQKSNAVPNKATTLSVLSVLEAIVSQKGYIDSHTFKNYVKASTSVENSRANFNFADTQPKAFNYKINSSGTNVNINYVYDGTVTLDEKESERVGLTKLLKGNVVRSTLCRSYSIIREGKINIPVLITHIPKSLYREFMEKDTVDGYDFIEKIEPSTLAGYKKVTLNISQLPIMDAKPVDMKTIYSEYISLCNLKAQNKVLKHYVSAIQESAIVPKEELTADQLQVLKAHGLNDKFEYVGVAAKHSDYSHKGVELKVKGLSTIPKVEDVMTKLKKRNFYVDSMTDYMEYLNQYSNLSSSDRLNIYKEELKAVNKSIDTLTRSMNLVKMALYLTNSNSISYDGTQGLLSITVNKQIA